MAYSWLALALVLQGAAAPSATQSVTVTAPGAPVELTVEWLRIDASFAGGVEVSSTRTFPAGLPVTLSVTPGADRYLRFSRANAAPVTVSVADVVAAKSYQLAERESGGELVVAFETDGVIASWLRISGPRTTIRDRRGHAVMAIGGLPAGVYEIEPAYSSGIPGAKAAVTIELSRSTMLVQKRESVGGLRVSAAPETCAASSDVVVAVDGQRGGSVSRPPAGLLPAIAGRGAVQPPIAGVNGVPRYQVTTFRVASGCERLVDGLPAGHYTVSYNAPGGSSVGSVGVDVAPQQLANAFVAAFPVLLSGTVLFNGRPAVGATLAFLGRAPNGEPLPRVPVGSDGHYSLALPASGDYTMTASFSQSPANGPHQIPLRLVDGRNTYDWNLAGGNITVLVNGWDPRTMLLASVTGRGIQMMTGLDGSNLPIRLLGLPHGVYTLYVIIPRTATSRLHTVTIDPANTEVSVSLEMAPNPSILRVKDEAGVPVSGLDLLSVILARPVPTSPGTFPLIDVPIGAEFLIQAPGVYAPCNVIAGPGDVEVTATRGRPVEVIFPTPVAGSMPPGTLGFGAGTSRCVVPLARFRVRKVDSPATESRFLVQNFPVVDKVTYQMTPTEQRELVVPASGPLIIR